MEKYVISGGHPLNGEVVVGGGKNAAVAIIPATVMVKEPCIIENLPDVTDVKLLLDILENMGAEVEYLDPCTAKINCANIRR